MVRNLQAGAPLTSATCGASKPRVAVRARKPATLPGAKPTRKRKSAAREAAGLPILPAGASLYGLLVAFMEALPITSGALAGTQVTTEG
jgi:hypothetical protein